MIGDIDYLRVLNYSDESARVYYVAQNKAGGDVVEFEKKDNEWSCSQWDTIWSDTGSASGVIWPYWWHFIYGGI
jgi:hypothetical protein